MWHVVTLMSELRNDLIQTIEVGKCTASYNTFQPPSFNLHIPKITFRLSTWQRSKEALHTIAQRLRRAIAGQIKHRQRKPTAKHIRPTVKSIPIRDFSRALNPAEHVDRKESILNSGWSIETLIGFACLARF